MKKLTALTLIISVCAAMPADAVTDYSGWTRDQLESEEARLTEELSEIEVWLTYGMSSAALYGTDEEVTPIEDDTADDAPVISLITAAPAQDLTGGAPQDLTQAAGSGPALVPADPGADVQVYTGNGDYVLTLETVPDRYLLEVTGNAGSDYFGVAPYDLQGNRELSVVSTTEPYHGIVLPPQMPVMLEISASGAWEIDVRPLESARTIRKGETVTGTGDEVILIDPSAGAPTTAAVTGNAGGNYFGVVPYDADIDRMISLINTTDPYSGTVLLKGSPALLRLEAVGDWSITLQ